MSNGSISQQAMGNALSIGVCVSVGLAMVRVLTGMNIMWLLIPGYVISLGLTFFVPSLFTGLAFAAGGVATPADAALMMQLGADGVFVGSGIFKSGDPAKRAAAIVQAVTNYEDADLLARVSANLGEAMVGINADEIKTIMEERGK